MLEFLKQASKASWGIFFYAGIIFVVAAVTGGFAIKSEYTTVKETLVPFLFLLGAILIAYTMYREWLDNRAKGDATKVTVKPDPATYKVEVTTPKFGEKVAPPDDFVVLQGKVKRDPKLDGLDLWYMSSGVSRFWPQRIPIAPDRTWVIRHPLTAGYKDGDHQACKFFVVGKNGQALYKAYKDLNDVLVVEGGSYEPLHVLTDDVYECIEHTFILKKHAEPFAHSSGSTD